MSDGGYSRLEKDFLGNERMVHYDGSGNMIGASDVVREPDGTLRVTNEPVHATTPTGLPDVQVIEPKPKAEPTAHIPADAGKAMAPRPQMPLSQTVTYVIATFIGAMLLTLAVLAFRASRSGSDASQQFGSKSAPIQNFDRQADPLPDRTPDQYPPDPKPRNDEQPDNNQPSDPTTAPDMNTGDDNHPKIEPGQDPVQADPGGDKGTNKGNSDDPIDLRGDGEPQKDPPKTGPTKGDPNDIH